MNSTTQDSSSSSSSSSTSSSKNGIMGLVNHILAPLGVILLASIIIIVSYIFARRRRRYLASTLHYNTTTPATDDDSVVDEEAGGLDEASITRLPSLLYSEQAKKPTKNDSDQSGTCSICLVEYADTDTIRLIPGCEHYFHVKCVDVWLKMHWTCPICRQSLLTAEWSSTLWSPRTLSRLTFRQEHRPRPWLFIM